MMQEREKLLRCVKQGIANHHKNDRQFLSDSVVDELISGGVMALPCKIGDTVWYISTENPFVAFEKELKAREDPDPISGILITKDGLYVKTGDIKEIVNLCDKVNEDYAYLSKEDAERALKRKEDEGK